MPRIYPVAREGDQLVEADSNLKIDGLSDGTIPKSAVKGNVGSLWDDPSDNGILEPAASDDSGIKVDAAQIDDLTIINSGATAYPTSDQTVPTSTETKMRLDDTRYEDANVTVDTSNNNITIETAGRYEAVGVGFLNDPGDQTQLIFRIYLNGSKEIEAKTSVSGGSNDDVAPVIFEDDLVAGDTIDFRVFQSSGGDVTLYSGKEFSSLKIRRTA